MILKIKSWCEGIIVAIIISIIIEMLVPDGNNKKYVKVVIGIYIIFVTLNPLFQLLNYQFDFSSLKFETEEVNSDLDENIKDVYIVGIEETIKKDLEELGYIVNSVKVFVDINYENIEKIEISISPKKDNVEIEPVIIGKDTIKENIDYSNVLKYFEENYSLEKDKVIFLN